MGTDSLRNANQGGDLPAGQPVDPHGRSPFAGQSAHGPPSLAMRSASRMRGKA